MTGKTKQLIDNLFEICDLLDENPDVLEKTPAGTIDVIIESRYHFVITKEVKVE